MTVDRTFVMPKRPRIDYGKLGFLDGVPFYVSEYDFLVDQRNEEEYHIIKQWVETELMPFMTRKSINERHSSYGLKHTAENEIGFYVSNGDIKLILMELGVPHKSYWHSPNVTYPLSQRFYRVKGKRR